MSLLERYEQAGLHMWIAVEFSDSDQAEAHGEKSSGFGGFSGSPRLSAVWIVQDADRPGRRVRSRCFAVSLEPATTTATYRQNALSAIERHPVPASGARAGIGAQFVANALCKGFEPASARAGAQLISQVLFESRDSGAADARTCFGRFADGLDAVGGTVAAGLSWIATNVFGLPEFVGQVLGSVGASLLLAPLHLHQVAVAVRVVDVVVSSPVPDNSANATLKDVTEKMLVTRFQQRDTVPVPQRGEPGGGLVMSL